MATVEDIAMCALAAAEATQPAVTSDGEADARRVLRRSALGAWFPGVRWELVDHNFPECQRHDGSHGLIVVRPSVSPAGLHFAVTLTTPWRVETPSETWLVAPSVAAAAERGGTVVWTAGAHRVRSPADVGRWLREQQHDLPAAA